MKRIVAIGMFFLFFMVSFALLTKSMVSAEEVIYREVFPNQLTLSGPGDLRKNEVFEQGWYGEQHGSDITDNPQDQDLLILDSSPSPNELNPVNSNPQGPGVGVSTGGAYYSRAQRAGIYIFTDEFCFPSSILAKVRWEARNSTCDSSSAVGPCVGNPDRVNDSKMCPAFRIGDIWYIADIQYCKNVYSPTAWVQYEFDLAGMTFGTASQYGPGRPGECAPFDGNCLPREDGNSGLSLPTGVITAFGFHVNKNFEGAADGNATMRIDNFELVGDLVGGGIGGAGGGQEPYVASVDSDLTCKSLFFDSPKNSQWRHFFTDYTCESFASSKPLNRPNLCVVPQVDNEISGFTINNGNHVAMTPLQGPTARIGKGNSGKYKWDIVLPKKPSGDLNITVQCGILKPNETDINECAGETGEVVGPSCTRGAGTLNYWGLPTIEATAYPGPFAETTFTTPFHLTAFRNPSTYGNWGYAKDTKNHQVLDGSKSSRIALKACFTKTLFVAMPANGRKNAKGETEHNLNAGDLISVLMTVPSANTVDIYCYPESVKVEGIGEPQSFLPDGSYNADLCKWTGGPDGILCDHTFDPPKPPQPGGLPVHCLDDQYVCQGCPDTGDPLSP